MGVSKWIKRRWAAHDQRLLDDELRKEAAHPGRTAASGTGGVNNPDSAVAANLGTGQDGASGQTGPAQ